MNGYVRILRCGTGNSQAEVTHNLEFRNGFSRAECVRLPLYIRQSDPQKILHMRTASSLNSKQHQRTPARRQRQGNVVILVVFVVVILCAVVAFAVDVGLLLLSRSQLQNSADAAALAGAGQLLDDRKQRISMNLASQPISKSWYILESRKK